MLATDCPDDNDLFSFTEGKLSGTVLDRLANHLTTCSRCQQRLDSLDEPADGVVKALRHASPRDSRQEQEAVRRLLESSRGEQVIAPKYALPSDLGDYQILGEIGRGGMGVVYRAFDRRRQEIVALKTLQGMDPSYLYRFKQEFRALAGVSHPNLVSLHRLVADGEVCYFTMELIDGVDFRSHVRGSSTPPPPTRALGSLDDTGESQAFPMGGPPLSGEQISRLRPALAQLARGLQALHTAGKLHRDLKPANVLVTPQGRVVILDFGLAGQLDPSGRHSSTVMIVGTLSYMAPEQADAAPVTPAADWYCVGVMLYEVLVGRTPYDGTAHQILLDKHRHDPLPPSSLVQGVPEDLERLCMDLLQRKPEKRPSGEEVVARLSKEMPTATPIAEARRALFVGRRHELQTLSDAFVTLRRGKTVLAQVRGRSGVGKSTLVQHFLNEARSRGAVVLEGRCYEQESVPYKAFDSLVDGLSRYLTRQPRPEVEAIMPREVGSLLQIFPVLGQAAALAQAPRRELPPDPRELRRRAFAALRELLARLGDRRPLVLSIDDLQWGDLDSAFLLTGLLLPPDPPLLMLLTSYRSEETERSAFLKAFLAEHHSGLESHLVDLSGLSEEEAGELARELMREKVEGNPSDVTRAELIARESHGSPLFVQELVQFLSTVGTKTIQGGFSDSELLDEVLWQRVVKLADPARQLLEVVAVAGRPLHEEDATRAAGLAGVDRTLLAQLRAERLLRGTGASSGEEVETYHDRVRESIRSHLMSDVRRELHRRLAEVLIERPEVEPELLAGHLHGAGREQEAGRHYERAAERATVALAFDKGAEYYRLALDLSQPDRESELRLRTLLANALMNAGRGAEAGREFLTASRLTSGLDALALKRDGALQCVLAGLKEEGTTALIEVIEALGLTWPATPRRILWGFLARHFWLRIRGLGFKERRPEDIPPIVQARLDLLRGASRSIAPSSPMLARYFQTHGLHLALQSGDPQRIAEFLVLEIGHESAAGGMPTRRIRKIWDMVEAFAQRFPDANMRAGMAVTRGFEGYLRGDWLKASRYLEEGEQIMRQERLGHAWDIALCHTIGLATLIYRGELASLQQRGPAAWQEARENGDLHTTRELSLVILVMVHLSQDRPEEAERSIVEAFDPSSESGFGTPHYLWLLGSFWTALYRGDAPRVRQVLDRCWNDYTGSLLCYMQKLRIDMHVMRAISWLELGETGTVERDIKAIERERMPWGDALAELLRAMLYSVKGEREECERRLEALIARFESLHMGLYAASVRRRLSELREDTRLIEEADRWMAAQKIRNPERMAGVFVPRICR